MMKLDTKTQNSRKDGSSVSPSIKSSRGSNSRPLGALRHGAMSNSVPKFPPLPTPRTGQNFDGISGSALSVPPPKAAAERPIIERIQQIKTMEKEKAIEALSRKGASPRKPLSSTGSAKSDTSKKTDDSSLKEKDLKISSMNKELQHAMIREKELKQQIMLLQKHIDELKQQVLDRDNTIKQLQEQFARQEEYYKELYEKECSRHKETQDFLQGVKSDLEKTRTQLEMKTEEYEKKIKDLYSEMEKNLSELRTQKDKEISVRDEKLTKLKKQMADALKGNSWERQQQLDELSKELTKVQEECDLLRMKLRSISKGSKSSSNNSCLNCDALKLQLSASQNVLKEKDGEMEKIKAMCVKFEKQLTQQDKALQQYAQSKGYKG